MREQAVQSAPRTKEAFDGLNAEVRTRMHNMWEVMARGDMSSDQKWTTLIESHGNLAASFAATWYRNELKSESYAQAGKMSPYTTAKIDSSTARYNLHLLLQTSPQGEPVTAPRDIPARQNAVMRYSELYWEILDTPRSNRGNYNMWEHADREFDTYFLPPLHPDEDIPQGVDLHSADPMVTDKDRQEVREHEMNALKLAGYREYMLRMNITDPAVRRKAAEIYKAETGITQILDDAVAMEEYPLFQAGIDRMEELLNPQAHMEFIDPHNDSFAPHRRDIRLFFDILTDARRRNISQYSDHFGIATSTLALFALRAEGALAVSVPDESEFGGVKVSMLNLRNLNPEYTQRWAQIR